MKTCDCNCHNEGCPKVTIDYILPYEPAYAPAPNVVRYGNTISSPTIGWTCAVCQQFVLYGHAHECNYHAGTPQTASPVYHVGVNVIEN